jgi:hypothetical protein
MGATHMIIFCPIYCSKKIVSNCKTEKEFFFKKLGKGGRGGGKHASRELRHVVASLCYGECGDSSMGMDGSAKG